MKESFRQCMAWLHTWVGLTTGWVLFFVFVTGTTGYVDDEITRWMRPELPYAAVQREHGDTSTMIGLALARLQAVAPQARSWTVTLPHRSREPRGEQGLAIAWETLPAPGQDRGRRLREELDPASGAPLPALQARATGGGTVLYRMHYLLHYLSYETGIKLVGICTMLMLLAVVTGVITHKRIFTDFFTFRPGKGQRSWLDAHNVVSVISLPFFLMITYTGLVFFAITYLPAARDALYGDTPAQRQAYVQELRGPARDDLPVSAPRVPLPTLVARLEAEWDGRVASLQMVHPRNATPYIDVRRADASGLHVERPVLRLSALDGTPLARPADDTTTRVRSTLFALHEGLFANWWLRWLYFISGLLGCAVIGTGLVLWTVKRRQQHRTRSADAGSFTARANALGLRLVEGLNAGTLVGLPLGLAAYFWANRLLPLALHERAEWEVHSLFLVWGWALLYACGRPVKRAWLELLSLAAVAYGAIPLLNALTTDKHLARTMAQGDWALAGFDLAMFGLAALFAGVALKLKNKWRAAGVPAAPPSGAARMSKRALSLRYRLQVASRVVAAAVGGYALTSATIVLVALLLPLPRAQAVLASSMLGFVWYTLAVIAVFSVRTAVRAWLAIALPTAAIALACAWLLPAAGSGP